MNTDQEEDANTVVEVRLVKVTPKAQEEKLHRAISLRKAKLAKLTSTVNQVRHLMESEDDSSLEEAKQLMEDFDRLFGEFYELNTNVKELFQQTYEDDKDKDQESWFEPKANSFKTFAETAHAWIQETILRTSEVVIYSQEVQPSDSISNASCSQRSATSSRHSSRASAASSTRMKAEIERATLLIKASSLKQKQALEEKEAKLKREKEELEMQTALAENEAKIKILSDYEERDSKSSVHDGMNAYAESRRVKSLPVTSQLSSQHHTPPKQVQHSNTLPSVPRTSVANKPSPSADGLQNVFEVLTKQQKLATLPPQNIPVFKGDPLEYRLFIRAFEHGVEDKTDNDKDRLYYMEQYTSGQPRELIRSCLHMDPTRGYKEAKRLLEEHFGNAYKISVAYINKALDWPTIKSDDGEALHAFGLYLTGCRNAMNDVELWRSAEHVMEQCKKMKKSLHKEKIDFLRAKGLCFSCLKQGHMSNSCKEKMSCQVCSQLHPTVLHIKAKTKEVEPEVESSGTGEKTSESVVNGFVGMKTPAHGTEDTEHILSIVPVQVKAKQGQKITQTHAFLDPGSTACFCTEELMQELSLTGRNTNILLKTMGEEKVVSSHIVSGLEVSSLDNNDFFELPDMYSHSNIPASVENVPSPEYVSKWPYLQQVSIPKIDAKIGLLIGTNAPKAIEPWQVIASEKAVRTQ
ncbi:hypothetical protein WMY93_027541 [Mugilogobius chulae]|uniref:CCHC-type domain-containing protein n=1 Tax=Mugilogobius chulae TaxID=88201 RepID=A0AAW0N3G0_9GOBI